MISIETVMTDNVIAVKKDCPIHDALSLLTKNLISGMPVLDDQKQVVGILTEKDVLRLLVDKNLNPDNTVEDYMTREVICFEETDDAIDICKFFIRSSIRRVPIVKNGKLVGIVSRRDIVCLILEAKSKMSNFRYG